MVFKKTANVDILGVQAVGSSWTKTAAGRFSSVYMDDGYGLDLEAALDSVADTYKISRDPRDYLLIPCRACSADRPNENMDAFQREELLRFDPHAGRRVYSTFTLKPHFVNHNATNYGLARGVLIDSHYNDQNQADDSVKRSVFGATGRDVTQDEFVETLIAVDITKDPRLAEAYKNGSVYRFSMGCDVESTECAICGKIATSAFQFCDHVRSKLARRSYPLDGGGTRVAFEWCKGTVFAELSAVDDPADKSAEVQEGILRIASTDYGLTLTRAQVNEISSFVARNASMIPESLAGLINSALAGR